MMYVMFFFSPILFLIVSDLFRRMLVVANKKFFFVERLVFCTLRSHRWPFKGCFRGLLSRALRFSFGLRLYPVFVCKSFSPLHTTAQRLGFSRSKPARDVISPSSWKGTWGEAPRLNRQA